MTADKSSVYATLSKIDVKPYLKKIPRYSKKNNTTTYLSYLSWATAWGLVKSAFPDANWSVTEYPNWVKRDDGTFQQCGTLDYRITSVGCEVETTVTIQGCEYTQKLYPMDRYNQPIMHPNIAAINKAQQRCLVKALAKAGLGLEVYAGEDLPSGDQQPQQKAQPQPAQPLKQYTEQELLTMQVPYGQTKVNLWTVYNAAFNQNDKESQQWWKYWYKRPETRQGNIVRQYSKLAKEKAKQGEPQECH